MLTVVLFVDRNTDVMSMQKGKKLASARRNQLMTRTLRKIGFIDDVTPNYDLESYPQAGEYWLVDIVRENVGTAPNKGCFVLKPIKRVTSLNPLIPGMYSSEVYHGTIVLTPPDLDKFWVLSSPAKKTLLDSYEGCNAIVINHGGEKRWRRRKPAAEYFKDGVRSITVSSEGNNERDDDTR